MDISRAFIYGDLLIETMAIVNGNIRFAPLHFKRLTQSAHCLNFHLPNDWSFDCFMQLVVGQCPEKNMRARLIAYRSGSGFYLSNTNEVAFHVDYWTLPEPKLLIDEIGIFKDQLKSCTPLSNLKSGNALIPVLASQYAVTRDWDDALILNSHHRVAEATSSNVFWVKNSNIYTPPLEEGPVKGVMREALMDMVCKQGFTVKELALDEQILRDADECFLTNVINPVVSVSRFQDKIYSTEFADVLRKNF